MRTLIIPLFSVLIFPQLLEAQITPGGFEPFGSSCAPPGGTACASHNPNGGSINPHTLLNEYAYPFTATTNLAVTGVEFFMSSVSGVATVPASLYKATGAGAPEVNPITTTTVTVGPTAAFYRGNFSKLQILTPGNYFVSAWCLEEPHKNPLGPSAVNPPDVTAGTTLNGIHWRRGSPTWQVTTIITTPSFKVICTGGAAPVHRAPGVPEIGKTFTAYVIGKPLAKATYILGISNKKWNVLNLPYTLGSPMPGCWLFVSMDITATILTDANGLGSLSLPLPPQKNLIGVVFYSQFMVADQQANPLGLLFSNAAKCSVGGVR